MLDKRSKIALKFFVRECSEGSYKILETDEIIAHLPKKYRADAQVIAQIVKYLENGEYISVKYSDAQQYCLCPLPFGRQFVENAEQDEKNKRQARHARLKNGIGYFFCSLLGAFFGTLVFYVL